MTFENFAKLTHATLLNSPTISNFENIQLKPKKIKRGDLFISDNKEDIELALSLEAYGIASQEMQEITDQEIAWFKIDSIDDVITRLLRYTLLEKNFSFVHATDQEMQIIKKIANKDILVFLPFNEKDSYRYIINADNNCIIISSNRNFLKKIDPEFEKLKDYNNKKIFITKQTLFSSSFLYEEKRYTNIKIPHIFISSLENILSFLKSKNINFDIEKCAYDTHFHPIFVDQKLNIKQFGKSAQVIICETDKNLIDKELGFISKHASWAKTVKVDTLDELKNIDFNFAIIAKNYQEIIKQLNQNQNQIGLF